MSGFLSFAMTNPAMLVVPALGAVAALWLVRIKHRYIEEGVFFGHAASAGAAKAEKALPLENASPTPSGTVAWNSVTLSNQAWAIALEGLIARYGSLDVAKTFNALNQQDEPGDAATLERALQNNTNLGRDWQVVRIVLGEPRDYHFDEQIRHLDALAAMMLNELGEAITPPIAKSQGVYWQEFIVELRRFRSEAESELGRAARST